MADKDKKRDRKTINVRLVQADTDPQTKLVDVLIQEDTSVLRLDDNCRIWILNRPYPVKVPEEALVKPHYDWENGTTPDGNGTA